MSRRLGIADSRAARHSVCEQCDPDVNPNGWSVKPGFFHDRDYANDLDCGRGSRSDPGACAPNNYGILFQLNTGGCQRSESVV